MTLNNESFAPRLSSSMLDRKWCQVTSLKYHSNRLIAGTTGGQLIMLTAHGEPVCCLQPHHSVPCYVADVLPLSETDKYLTVGQGYRDSISQLLSGTRKDNSSSSLHLLSWFTGTSWDLHYSFYFHSQNLLVTRCLQETLPYLIISHHLCAKYLEDRLPFIYTIIYIAVYCLCMLNFLVISFSVYFLWS